MREGKVKEVDQKCSTFSAAAEEAAKEEDRKEKRARCKKSMGMKIM